MRTKLKYKKTSYGLYCYRKEHKNRWVSYLYLSLETDGFAFPLAVWGTFIEGKKELKLFILCFYLEIAYWSEDYY